MPGSLRTIEVRIIDNTTDYRIAINVMSQLAPSEVEYVILERFEHPITALADRFPLGFTPLPSKPNSGALDFIRGNLFNRSLMRPLPANLPGFDNDLNDKIDRIMQRAVSDEHAVVCAFGQRWGPEPGVKDKYFGFLPGNGIHDIHMNQGNAGQFVKDDGVYQDGGLLIHFPDQNEWIAAFMKFQSQAWHTDDVTGHTIETGQPPAPTPTAARLRCRPSRLRQAPPTTDRPARAGADRGRAGEFRRVAGGGVRHAPQHGAAPGESERLGIARHPESAAESVRRRWLQAARGF